MRTVVVYGQSHRGSTYHIAHQLATSWQGVNEKKKAAIDRKTTELARTIVQRNGCVKPGLKTRATFFAMHLMQRKGYNPRDVAWWEEHGWTGKVRPWK